MQTATENFSFPTTTVADKFEADISFTANKEFEQNRMLTATAKLPSRYLVEKKNYLFSSTKLILVLTNTEIQLHQVSKFPHKLEKIDLSQVQKVNPIAAGQQQSSSSNPTPLLRQTGDADISGELQITSRGNNTCILNCKERARLITEIHLRLVSHTFYLYTELGYSKRDEIIIFDHGAPNRTTISLGWGPHVIP
jgi:hypothetical protein